MPTLFPAPSGAGLSLGVGGQLGTSDKNLWGLQDSLALSVEFKGNFPGDPALTSPEAYVRQGLPQLELPSWVHLPLSLGTKYWTVLLAEAGDRGMLRHPFVSLVRGMG